MRGGGVYSTPLAPASLTIRSKLGSVIIANTTTSSILISQANAAFNFSGVFVVRSVGTNGLVVPVGGFDFAGMNSTSRTFADMVNGGAGVTVNTTIDQNVDVTVQWLAAQTSQTVKVTSATVTVDF